jgi:hypothetical protein
MKMGACITRKMTGMRPGCEFVIVKLLVQDIWDFIEE